MTFDEFFKKKRIDLAALQQAEAALFSEFKDHFEQMGDKSFDHSKKYWFNKLRRQFPLATEVRTEKPHTANPIAEQTISESLSEPVAATAAPKIGFTPKFRAPAKVAPAAETMADDKSAEIIAPANAETPKPAYVPKFKPKLKTDDTSSTQSEPTAMPDQPETKQAYTPKFKMQFKPKAEDYVAKNEKDQPEPETPKDEAHNVKPAPELSSKPAYVPRFKMQAKPKVEDALTDDAPADSGTTANNNKDDAIAEKQPEIKPAAYKPKFKMQFKPKPGEE